MEPILNENVMKGLCCCKINKYIYTRHCNNFLYCFNFNLHSWVFFIRGNGIWIRLFLDIKDSIINLNSSL